MKKLLVMTAFILLGGVNLLAQQKSIVNYSFQESSLAVSKLPEIKINMLIGKTVIGTSGSDNFIVKSGNFFNLKLQENETSPIVDVELPSKYSLEQNYPNPFNPVTRIKYSVPSEGYVSLAVFNMLGEKVQQLVDETKSPGTYTIDWNAKDFTSGIYLYTIRSGNYTESKKLTLLK